MPPWEKYQQGSQSGPWAKYAQPAQAASQSDVLSRLENSGDYGGVRAAAGNFLEGIPIVGPALRGGAERIAAGIIAAGGPETYGETLAAIQKGAERNDEAHPATSFGSQLAGGVAGTLPLVAAAPAAFGAGSGGILARSAASALSGSALGAADSAVRSGGNPQDILRGAEWGLGLGAVAPGVGQAVGAGTRALASRLGSGASNAERAFGRAMSADDITDPTAALAARGSDAMPMDLGPNLQRQAGALAATPGRGQEVVRSAIADRQAQASPRVTKALNRVLGKPVDTFDVSDNWIRLRAANAKPAYESAYEAGEKALWSPELERLSSSPSVQRAMRGAVNAWRDRAIADGFGAMNPGALVDKGGQLTFLQGKVPVFPNLQFWDYTKRILDDQVRAAYKAGQNQKGEALSSLARMLRTDLDKMVPEYNAARQAYAGPSAIIDALERGQQVFSNDMTPGELRNILSGMTAGEREAFLQGGRAKLTSIMGTARNDALKGRQLFDRGFNKEKLAELVGPEQADELLKTLDAETAFTRTRDVVTGNSETAARAAAMDEVAGNRKTPGFLRSALNLRFGDAAGELGDRALGGLQSTAQQRMNEELAQLLTSRDPKAITRAVKMVQQAQRRGDISAQRSREIVQGLMLAPQRRPLELTVNPSP